MQKPNLGLDEINFMKTDKTILFQNFKDGQYITYNRINFYIRDNEQNIKIKIEDSLKNKLEFNLGDFDMTFYFQKFCICRYAVKEIEIGKIFYVSLIICSNTNYKKSMISCEIETNQDLYNLQVLQQFSDPITILYYKQDNKNIAQSSSFNEKKEIVYFFLDEERIYQLNKKFEIVKINQDKI